MNRSIDYLRDDPDFVRRVRTEIFKNYGSDPRQEDLEDAFQIFMLRFFDPQYYEEGQRANWYVFVRSLARFAARCQRAESFIFGTNAREIEPVSIQSLDEFGGDDVRPELKVLNGEDYDLGATTAWSDCLLGTPAYRVDFQYDECNPRNYKDDPYFIPQFDIVPKDHVGRRKRRERWYSFYESEVPSGVSTRLAEQREAYCYALRRALREYLRLMGWLQLLPIEQKIVSLIRRHGSHAEVQRAGQIPRSTYKKAVRRMERHGWLLNRTEQRGMEFTYNPLMDCARTFVDRASLDKILDLRADQLLSSSPYLFQQMMGQDELGIDDIVVLCCDTRMRLIAEKLTDDSIRDYDAEMRRFISITVVSPTILPANSLGGVEELLMEMPRSKASELILRAMRYRRPLSELLSVGDLRSTLAS